MKKYYLLGALALGLMTSCQNKDDALGNLSSQSKVEATASLDLSSKSRTALQLDRDSYKVVWSKDDAFSVFYGSPDAKSKFELQTGEGETTGTFESGNFKISSGIESGPNGFAVVGYYPYSDATSVSKSGENYVIKAEIPVNQSYIENSFAQNASPMVAVTEGSLIFSFKNVASALRVPLLGDKTIVKATLTGSSKIAGPATVTAVSSDNWIPEVSIEDTKGSSTIVLTCGEGVELNSTEAKNFIFVLKPGTYPAGMVVKFYASDGTYYSYTTQGEQTFTRSIVTYINPKTYGTTGTGHDNGTAGIEDANAALKAGAQNVDVTISSTDENPTLELPATTSDNPTNINFESIPSGTTVTITASTESNSQEAKNVNLSVPASQEGYSFDINLPNSTVTLGANGESATYDDVTASTAEETLIISKNVTVNTLKIKKGHVRVYGRIGNISREGAENGDVTYIIKEEDAEISNNLEEGFEIVPAAEWDLRKAIEKGGIVTLTQDVEITNAIQISNEVTINLNECEIKNATATASGKCQVFLVREGGNLTIEGDGTVNAAAECSSAIAVYSYDGGTVTIKGGTYMNKGTENAGSELIYVQQNGIINIYGGTFEVGNVNKVSFADKTNGVYAALNLYGSATGSINVYGGTFKNFDPANPGTETAAWNATHPNGFVAAGYSSVQNGEYYEVSEGIKNEQALKSALLSCNEVTLSMDIELTSPIILDANKTVTLNLGEFNIVNNSECTADTDGNITEGTGDCYIFVVKNGKLTIDGNGTISANAGTAYDMAVWALGGEVEIKGGTFRNLGIQDQGSDVIYAKKDAVVNIYGGTFIAGNVNKESFADKTNGVYAALNLHGDATGSINVYGGSFYKFDPANPGTEAAVWNEAHPNGFVADGYSSVSKGDYFEVSSGIMNEQALKSALLSCNEVTLGENIELTSPIILDANKTVTLNLGEFNIVNNSECTADTDGNITEGTGDCYVFVVKNGKLTIDGNGTISANAGTAYDMAVWALGGEVEIKGGTFRNLGIQDQGSDVIYAKKDAVVNIYGGTFIAGNVNKESFADKTNGVYAALNLHGDATGSINVYGGSFYKFDPANPGTEAAVWNEAHPNGFVAENYTSTKGQDEYYVVTGPTE